MAFSRILKNDSASSHRTSCQRSISPRRRRLYRDVTLLPPHGSGRPVHRSRRGPTVTIVGAWSYDYYATSQSSVCPVEQRFQSSSASSIDAFAQHALATTKALRAHLQSPSHRTTRSSCTTTEPQRKGSNAVGGRDPAVETTRLASVPRERPHKRCPVN